MKKLHKKFTSFLVQQQQIEAKAFLEISQPH